MLLCATAGALVGGVLSYVLSGRRHRALEVSLAAQLAASEAKLRAEHQRAVRGGAGGADAVKGTAGKVYPPVNTLLSKDQKRILVSGGAGFVGSHLVDALMMQVLVRGA